MKNRQIILLLGLLFGFNLIGVGQEENQMQYIFSGQREIHLSGMGGPFVGFSSIGDEFAVSVGGGGAVLINQKFFIGGYGQGIASRHERNYEIYSNYYQENLTWQLNSNMGHGGFWMGYIHNPMKAIHLAFSTKVGFGAISLFEGDYHSDWEDEFISDNIFVLNPQIEVELNLLRWMKVNFGFGYRLVTGVNKEYQHQDIHGNIISRNYFEQSDYNKPIGHISILFGWFSN